MTEGIARAYPNIALVKYWGKKTDPDVINAPATPSLSITLESLWSRTRVRFDPELKSDRLLINGSSNDAQLRRVSACLDEVRKRSSTTLHADVVSENNFPTGAGIASSASGFAALVTAAWGALDLPVSDADRSRISRRSSASAARSIFGGFVQMDVDNDPTAQPLLDGSDWPLEVLVALTSMEPKAVGSTEGMRQSASTSDYYDAWVRSAPTDFSTARKAVICQDFDTLTTVSESSCLKMHSVMLSTRPSLLYWNGATVESIRCIRRLRADGIPVFFTIDAGPQVKAVFLPGYREQIEQALAAIPGVLDVMHSHLGPGAHLEKPVPEPDL